MAETAYLVFKDLLKEESEPECKCKKLERLLHQAVDESDIEKVKFLVAHVSNINEIDKVSGLSILHKACMLGNIEIVKLLLEYKAKVNLKDRENSETPLHLAANWGHKNLVELLLSYGAKVECTNNNGNKPLYEASMNGHEEVVQLLLGIRVDINNSSFENDTPLHMSAENGHLDVLKLHLSYGATVDVRNNEASTPLHIACKYGYTDIIQYLLNNFTDVNAKDEMGLTPLHIALINEYTDAIKLLVNSDANIYEESTFRQTPVQFAIAKGTNGLVQHLFSHVADSIKKENNVFCKYIKIENTEINKEVIFNILSNYHANASEVLFDNDGILIFELKTDNNNLLALAAEGGHLQMAQYLMNTVPDSNYPLYLGKRPIHIAVFNNHIEIADLFLKNGVSIDQKTEDDQSTPLHLACFRNNIEMVRHLLNCNPEIITTNIHKFSPLHVACQAGFAEIVEILLDAMTIRGICLTDFDDTARFSKITPLTLAVTEGHTDVVKLLIKSGANFNIPNCWSKRTPIQDAAYQGHFNIIKLLVQTGAAVTDISKDGSGSSLLHLSAHGNNEAAFEFLVSLGLNANALDNNRRTPLHLVCLKGWTKAAKLLLTKKASFKVLNALKKSPLYYAILANQNCLAELLLKHGAYDYIDAADKYDLLLLATNRKSAEFIQYVIRTNYEYLQSLTDLEIGHLFFEAAQSNFNTLVRFLFFNFTIDINGSYDTTRCTPLHAACGGNASKETVLQLLHFGADVDALDAGNQTALHKICQNREPCKEVLRLLLDYNARVNVKDITNGDTPLLCALKSPASSHKIYKVTELLIQNGALLNIKNNQGYTPLHLSIYKLDTKLISLLIDNGANLEAKNNIKHSTILHYACKIHSYQVVDLLLKKGSNIHATSLKGNTALHKAVKRKNAKAVILLLKKHASVNFEKISTKDTPLHLLANDKHLAHDDKTNEILVHLLDHGADATLKNKDGYTPVDLFPDKIKQSYINISEEIEKMKIIKLNGYTTLFNVLFMDQNVLSRYVKNEILQNMYKNSFRDQFPYHKKILTEQFVKGLRRRALFNASKNALETITNLKFPEESFYDQIFSYLNNRNLGNIIACTEKLRNKKRCLNNLNDSSIVCCKKRKK